MVLSQDESEVVIDEHDVEDDLDHDADDLDDVDDGEDEHLDAEDLEEPEKDQTNIKVSFVFTRPSCGRVIKIPSFICFISCIFFLQETVVEEKQEKPATSPVYVVIKITNFILFYFPLLFVKLSCHLQQAPVETLCNGVVR